MGSTRSKINENIGTKCFKTVKWQILAKTNRPTVDPFISGTKCGIEKTFFTAERGGGSIRSSWAYNRNPTNMVSKISSYKCVKNITMF